MIRNAIISALAVTALSLSYTSTNGKIMLSENSASADPCPGTDFQSACPASSN